MRIRKQVYELTAADIEAHPVWEFALDEEGEEGQDEATVRPFATDGPLDPSDGMFVVRARFVLADGTAMSGYLTPRASADDGLGDTQPVILVDGGFVGFWMGMIKPSSEEVAGEYTKLGGRTAAQVFPLCFASDVPLVGGEVSGTIPGFVLLEDWDANRTRVIT